MIGTVDLRGNGVPSANVIVGCPACDDPEARVRLDFPIEFGEPAKEQVGDCDSCGAEVEALVSLSVEFSLSAPLPEVA